MKIKSKIKSALYLSLLCVSLSAGSVFAGEHIDKSRIKDIIVEKGTQIKYENYIGGGLPSGAKLEVIKAVDTSYIHDDEAEIKIVYDDNTEETFKVKVSILKSISKTVKEKKTTSIYNIDNAKIQSKLVTKGQTLDQKMIEDCIRGIPTGSKIEHIYTPSTNTVGKFVAKVKITFPDSTVQTVEVPVEIVDKAAKEKIRQESNVDNTINKNYTVESKDIITEVVSVGDKINLVDNIKNLPNGSSVTEIKIPETNVAGSFKGTVKVTFPDGKTQEVEIPVSVVNKNNTSLNTTSSQNSTTPQKGEPIKGELVKTGDEAKKTIVGAILVILAGGLGGFTYFKRKKMKNNN